MRHNHIARALLMAILTHGAFALAVGSMAFALATGLQFGQGGLTGTAAAFANLLLVLQFPLVHSFLLSRRGGRVLQRLSPVGHGRTLAISTYVLTGSLQLLLTFWAWSPSGVVWHHPEGALGALQWTLFAGAWVLLNKALWDAGLSTQSGLAGWWALLRGRDVDYGPMPERGLFACCRQPIYLGFALVLWTSPTWSPDLLLLVAPWTAYCLLGPLLKEARWQRMHGDRFTAYRARVPYMMPRIRK